MKNLFRMSKRAVAVCLAVFLLIGVLPLGGLLSSAETVELMNGGDFETGAISGNWQEQTNVPVVTDLAHGGSYAAKVDTDNNSNNMLQGYISNLTPGVNYNFSFWYYVPAGKTVQIQLFMQGVGSYAALPNESSRYSVPVNTGSLTAHDTWLQFTKEFTLAQGDSGMQFQLYSRQDGDVYYLDDVSVTYEVAAPTTTYIDIDFDVATDVINGVNYNSANDRTYLSVQTAKTLPVDGWAAYSGSTTLTIDGTSVAACAAGLGSANQMQIYTADGTGNFTSATEITVPAGTEFTKDNTIVRFTKDFTIVKSGGAWVKKEEATLPTDHTTTGANLPDGKTNLVTFGGFNAASGFSISGNGAVTGGMLRMELSGSDDMASFQVPVTAGSTYRMSVYMWVMDSSNIRIDGEAAGHKTAYQNYIYSDANAIAGASLKADTEGWVEMIYEFTADNTATASIYFVRNYWGGDAVVYVDDLCIYDVNEQPPVVVTPTDHGGDTELPENAVSAGVQNGDLSSTEGQSFNGATLESGMGLITAGGQYIQFNNVTVTQGVEYTLAFYVWVTKASADMDFDVFFTTSAASPSGAWTDFAITHANVTSNLSDGIKTTTDGWQRVTLKWTPAADGSAQFGLKNYGSASGCAIYIDDVSVTYEETVEYIKIYDEMVSLFAAQAQEGNNRTVFGIEIDGVNIPYDANWRNFGYRNVLVDGVTANIPFGTTTTSTTWGMDSVENKMLLYLPLGAYEASTVTIPAGTQLVHPADSTLAYEFAEDIVITRSDVYGWPEKLLRGSEVALGDVCRLAITVHIPSYYSESGLQLQYTVNGVTATAALTAVENGLYTASIATSLKNIGDDYALQLIDAEGNPVGAPVESYSVEDYALSIVDSMAGYSEAEQNAALMLLNVGLKAQRYFGYNPDDEIVEWITFPDASIAAMDEQIAQLTDMVIPDGADNYVGSTLVLKDVTKIRLYFTDQVAGSELSSNGFYYLEIDGITATELDTMYEVNVGDVTYKVSVLSLVKQVVVSESTSDAFKELARALYLYNLAAEELARA